MATTPRRKNRKPIHFNSPELHALMLERAFCMKEKPDYRWFEAVSDTERYHFALKYGTKLWDVCPNGNPSSIVVSYPRQRGGKVMVRMFDLDSGEMFWVRLNQLVPKRISGRNSERNYEFNTVCMDDYRCESEDITYNIEWEDLKQFDRGVNRSPFNNGARLFHPEEVKLISLPRSVKDRKEEE